jgi:hypothetical protein
LKSFVCFFLLGSVLVPETLAHDPLGLVLVVHVLGFLEFRHALSNDILLSPVAVGDHVLDALGSSPLVEFCLFLNRIKELADVLSLKLKLFVLKGAFLLDLR